MLEPLVLVINLARSQERLAAIAERLAKVGLAWQRVDAVDGGTFGALPWEHFDAFAYRYLWGKPPHPNELGCYLSHYRAMEVFLATDRETAVILEDDAVVDGDIGDVLHELIENADRWDVVKLDSRHWGMPVTTLAMRNGRRLVAHTQRTTGAAGYLLNRRAAERYVQGLLPMKVPYDHAFDQVWRYRLRMRAVLPSPVKAAPVQSDIGYEGRRGLPAGPYRRFVAPFYRGAIEIARVVHYLVFDRAWLEWLTSRVAGGGAGRRRGAS